MNNTTKDYPSSVIFPPATASRKAVVRLRYQKRVIGLILIFALIRGIMAFSLTLGNDESYYWLYSKQLQWNYFDHPPMVAIWIRIFTANLLLDSLEGFIRLGSVVGCALSTWFLYRTCALIHSERAGWFAAVLYNTSFYAGIITGLFIWPDSPQMVFWTGCLWLIARLMTDERAWITWILFGIVSGLCIMSKVHGSLIWAGLILFLLWKRRNWLLMPQLYVSAFIALAIASPILIWNINYDFATYAFHSQRVKVHQFEIDEYSFLKESVGQILFNNPIQVGIMVWALISWKRRSFSSLPALTVYNLIGLPLIFLLLIISMFRDSTLPHWSGPAYVSLMPLAAIHLTGVSRGRLFPSSVRWCFITFFAFIIGWNLTIYLYPGTWGSQSKQTLGKSDLTLDFYGWKEAGKNFTTLYKREVAAGIMPEGAPIICYKWWGAHLEYYFGRPSGAQMIGLGSIQNLHQYLWFNAARKDLVNLSKAYCIVPSDEFYDVREMYGIYYKQIELVTTLKTYRANKPAHNFFVYRLSGWKNKVPYISR